MIMLKLAVTLRVNLSGPRQRRYEYDTLHVLAACATCGGAPGVSHGDLVGID